MPPEISVPPASTDALVVGAGPVGLATAVTVASHGVDVTIVDREVEGVNTSPAAAVHARGLEVLATIGAAGRSSRGASKPPDSRSATGTARWSRSASTTCRGPTRMRRWFSSR